MKWTIRLPPAPLAEQTIESRADTEDTGNRSDRHLPSNQERDRNEHRCHPDRKQPRPTTVRGERRTETAAFHRLSQVEGVLEAKEKRWDDQRDDITHRTHLEAARRLRVPHLAEGDDHLGEETQSDDGGDSGRREWIRYSPQQRGAIHNRAETGRRHDERGNRKRRRDAVGERISSDDAADDRQGAGKGEEDGVSRMCRKRLKMTLTIETSAPIRTTRLQVAASLALVARVR